MKQRRQELSVMNVLFCLAVIMIHILAYPVSSFPVGSIKYTFFMIPWRMMSFVVQGFIFLSGVKLFLTNKDKLSYKDYLKSRCKAILGPYIFCTVVYCTFYILFYGYIITLDYYLSRLVFGNLAVHFYFIPLLLQFDILLPFWKKLVYKCSAIFVIPLFIMISAYFEKNMVAVVGIFTNDTIPIFNDRVFTTYMSFWVIGCFVGRYYDEFCDLLKKNFCFICVVFGAMFVTCAVSSGVAYNELDMIPDMNTIHYFYSLTAIIFLFALSLKLPEGITAKIPLFDFIDRQSYDIYLWHLLVLMVADYCVRHLGLAMQSLAFIFRVLFVYTFTAVGVKILQWLRSKLNPAPVPAPKVSPQQNKLTFKVEYKKRAGRS